MFGVIDAIVIVIDVIVIDVIVIIATISIIELPHNTKARVVQIPHCARLMSILPFFPISLPHPLLHLDINRREGPLHDMPLCRFPLPSVLLLSRDPGEFSLIGPFYQPLLQKQVLFLQLPDDIVLFLRVVL